jgi:integrase
MMLVSDVPKNLALPYVKRYRDSGGVLRHYFRKRGHKAVALPGVPGSADFMTAYQDALGEPAPQRGSRQGQGPGSVGALIVEYQQSAAFANLKPSSQRVYRRVLDRFREIHGHRMVHDMPRAKVAAYIAAIGADAPAMANLTQSVLHKLLAHAIRLGHRTDNPVTEIDRYDGGEHHTWTNAELAAFESRWPLGTRERLAYALLLHTDQREGDVVRMRRSDITGGAIAVTQEKTGTSLMVPIDQELDAAMKAGPANSLFLIAAANGRPITRQTLYKLVRKAARAAGLPPCCVPHGLRKAQMRRLAEAGASTHEIASMSGHKTLREVQRYTDAADQQRLSRSALAKLNREQGSV